MKSLRQYIYEFQGWPDWDDADEISSPKMAAELIKENKDFKQHGWNYFYSSCDDRKILDYIQSELELDDRKELAAYLELTGMLSEEVDSFEFTEPIKDKLTLYTDDIGDDNISFTLCYEASMCPKEFLDFKRNDSPYVYIDSKDLDPKDFEKRHNRLPRHGLVWAFCATGYSSTVQGYWYKDNIAKSNMKEYCGLIEFKKGKIIT